MNVNYSSTLLGSSSWDGLKAIWLFLMGKEKLLVTATSQCPTSVGISQFHLPNFSQLRERQGPGKGVAGLAQSRVESPQPFSH